MSKDAFMKLKRNYNFWGEVMGSIAYRDFRREADDIDETPMEEVKFEEQEKFKREMADPVILDLLMGPRHVIDGKIQPYDQHPDYLEYLKK